MTARTLTVSVAAASVLNSHIKSTNGTESVEQELTGMARDLAAERNGRWVAKGDMELAIAQRNLGAGVTVPPLEVPVGRPAAAPVQVQVQLQQQEQAPAAPVKGVNPAFTTIERDIISALGGSTEPLTKAGIIRASGHKGKSTGSLVGGALNRLVNNGHVRAVADGYVLIGDAAVGQAADEDARLAAAVGIIGQLKQGTNPYSTQYAAGDLYGASVKAFRAAGIAEQGAAEALYARAQEAIMIAGITDTDTEISPAEQAAMDADTEFSPAEVEAVNWDADAEFSDDTDQTSGLVPVALPGRKRAPKKDKQKPFTAVKIPPQAAAFTEEQLAVLRATADEAFAVDPAEGVAPEELVAKIASLNPAERKQVRAFVMQAEGADPGTNGAIFALTGLMTKDDLLTAKTEAEARRNAPKPRKGAAPKPAKEAYTGIAQPTSDFHRVIAAYSKAHGLSDEGKTAIVQAAIALAAGEQRASHEHALQAVDALSDRNGIARFDRTAFLNKQERAAYEALQGGTQWADLDKRARAGTRYWGITDHEGRETAYRSMNLPIAPPKPPKNKKQLAVETPAPPAQGAPAETPEQEEQEAEEAAS